MEEVRGWKSMAAAAEALGGTRAGILWAAKRAGKNGRFVFKRAILTLDPPAPGWTIGAGSSTFGQRRAVRLISSARRIPARGDSRKN